MRAVFFALALLPLASGCSLALDLDQFLGADAGGRSDAGTRDAGPSDAGDEDAATPRDAGPVDAGMEPCLSDPDRRCPVQIAGGIDFTCARFQTGEVGCWGSNELGQLGDGTAGDTRRRAPGALVRNLSDVSDLSANAKQACAVAEGGMVFCWGEQTNGEAQRSPIGVHIEGAVHVSVGGWHRCVLTSVNAVFCWGLNENGEVGTDDPGAVPDPTEVQLSLLDQDERVEQLSAGSRHTCARTNKRRVYCWGANHHGQLGGGTISESSHVPVMVPDIRNAVNISAGGFYTCAVRETGEVLCWGYNDHGQLGRGSVGREVLPPAPVVELSDAVEIRTGTVHTCARRANGVVMCWGDNRFGQLGIGSADSNRPKPVEVLHLEDPDSIAAGESHTCALTHAGSALCWGSNEHGQLGNASTENLYAPRDVIAF